EAAVRPEPVTAPRASARGPLPGLRARARPRDGHRAGHRSLGLRGRARLHRRLQGRGLPPAEPPPGPSAQGDLDPPRQLQRRRDGHAPAGPFRRGPLVLCGRGRLFPGAIARTV
ncbi:MAG: hypothetical protein AVDCRST_MAG68-1152, partial [uncultured Gemmatimonadetes bacterium]